MASSITRFDIKKLDGNIVQNHGGLKQVGLKQLGSNKLGSNNLVINKLGSNNLVLVLKQESMKYKIKNVFGLRWNCRELKGIVKLRIFMLVTMMLQWLKDSWRKSNLKTNTDYLVNEQEKVHLGINVGADIMVTEVPGQEGPEGNVVGRKKRRSKEARLGNLLKARLTRRSKV
ncbi:hypothetical protein Tco_1401909 [Tanacetum coccineum]